MATQRTLALIKPNGAKHTSAIMEVIKENQFLIIARKLVTLTPAMVAALYPHHAAKDWFPDYVKSMSGGQTFAMVLEKRNAIKAWRKVMGSRDKSDVGTIRNRFATDSAIVHGSDGQRTARREIALIFSSFELM